MAIVFDGQQLAAEKEAVLKEKIARLKTKLKLVIVLVGDNPASRLYVQKKKEVGERVGIEVEIKSFRAGVSEQAVIDFLEERRETPLIVQLPLPQRFKEIKIRQAIPVLKDVDCLHPENLGLVLAGQPRFYPAAVKAVLEILKPWQLAGKEIVIAGASNLVGKPLAMALVNLGATVTVCRSTTRDLIQHTRQAEILISATGQAGLIKKEMVKKGAVVIDVGETKGDVEPAVAEVASFVSLVPGGVGPMTVVSLLENVVKSVYGEKEN